MLASGRERAAASDGTAIPRRSQYGLGSSLIARAVVADRPDEIEPTLSRAIRTTLHVGPRKWQRCCNNLLTVNAAALARDLGA